MTLDTDVLILGGGCAGLSLAVALAERAPSLQVHTLESRTCYKRDRTWCFWDTAQHPFTDAVTHKWHEWRVRSDGQEARQKSLRYSYQHLPADRFYDLATGKIHAAKQALSVGVTVQAIQQRGDSFEVQTDHGVLRSRWLFDSRPLEPHTCAPVLAQRFVGWHVRCEQPCFDPSVVDLMDFQQFVQPRRTSFLYVLPFSSTEALVEATYLDDPALAPERGEALIEEHLERLCARNYQVLYREAAVLPMGNRCKPPESHRSWRAIGTRGGRVKASSGYAFQRIQRQSLALATALGQGGLLPERIEPRFYSVLDAVFLRALQRSPERAGTYFLRLFGRVPADTLVRFLSETATLPDVLQVMLSLPKTDFIRAALSASGGGWAT